MWHATPAAREQTAAERNEVAARIGDRPDVRSHPRSYSGHIDLLWVPERRRPSSDSLIRIVATIWRPVGSARLPPTRTQRDKETSHEPGLTAHHLRSHVCSKRAWPDQCRRHAHSARRRPLDAFLPIG